MAPVLMVAKFSAMRPFIMPTAAPQTAISARGIILMTVVDTWNLPASLGARALSTWSRHSIAPAMVMQAPPVMSQPSSTQKYRAEIQARADTRQGVYSTAMNQPT